MVWKSLYQWAADCSYTVSHSLRNHYRNVAFCLFFYFLFTCIEALSFYWGWVSSKYDYHCKERNKKRPLQKKKQKKTNSLIMEEVVLFHKTMALSTNY